jgi:hypothetical protein
MEPTTERARLITMRLLAATVVLCLGTLSACGTTGEQPDQAGDHRSTPSHSATLCAESGAGASAKVDLDGDGAPEDVQASATGKCPGSVSSEVDGNLVSASIKDATPVTSVFGVSLAGRAGQLAVTRQDNPRGGYQLHIFALDGKKLVELEDGDQPLVPFVATDVRPISATVDCRGAKIVVDQAVAGSGGTWDVRRTTYAVDGSTATKSSSTAVASNVTPKQVDQLMPAGDAVFPSCRA